MPGTASSIAALIDGARASDREAFAGLYRLTVTPVFRYLAARVATTEEAEELTQEVYLAALTGVQRLRATEEPELLAWLFQIARHKLADHLRRRYRRPTVELEQAGDPPDAALLPDQLAVASEAREQVRRALAELTDDQREVMTCKYILGLSNEETARVTGKNANAVNQLHHRALKRLHGLLAAEADTR